MSITEEIWNVLRTDLAIQKDLERGLINHRALARYVLKHYPIKASMESVISAIRRFRSEKVFDKSEKELLTLFKESVISTKNNIACITIRKGTEKKLSAVVGDGVGETLRVIHGSKSAKILLDQGALKRAEKMFTKNEIIRVEQDLSELSVVLNEKISKTRGVLARIAEEISLHNINIEEMIICPPEFLIYVKQSDILRTYESLLKLRERKV